MLVIFFVFLVFDSIQPFKHIYSADKENKDYVSIGGIEDDPPEPPPVDLGTPADKTNGPQVNIAGVPAGGGAAPLIPAPPPPPKRAGGANRGLTLPGSAAPTEAKRRRPGRANRSLGGASRRRAPNRTLKQPGTSAKKNEGPKAKAAKGNQGNLESSSEDQNTMSSENTLVCRMILYLISLMRFLIFLFEKIWSNHLPCMR